MTVLVRMPRLDRPPPQHMNRFHRRSPSRWYFRYKPDCMPDGWERNFTGWVSINREWAERLGMEPCRRCL